MEESAEENGVGSGGRNLKRRSISKENETLVYVVVSGGKAG